MALCAITQKTICWVQGGNSFVPVTDMFQQINGAVTFLNADTANGGAPAVGWGQSTAGITLNFTGSFPSNPVMTLNVSIIDNDGIVTCPITFIFDDDCNNNSTCLDASFSVPVGGTIDILPNQVATGATAFASPAVVTENDPSGCISVLNDETSFVRVSCNGGSCTGSTLRLQLSNGSECTVTVSCTGTGGGGTCQGIGTQNLNINQTVSISPALINSSGQAPTSFTETNAGTTFVSAFSPNINVMGVAAGTNTITFNFPNGDSCPVTFSVGGGGANGLCIDAGVIQIPVSTNSFSINPADLNSSGAAPIDAPAESNPNGNVASVGGLSPNIVIVPEGIGTNIITFEFPNGDLCPLEIQVIADDTVSCPFACGQVLSSLDGGAEGSNLTYTLDCNTNHSLSIYVPHPENVNIGANPIFTPGNIINTATFSSNTVYDTANQRSIITMNFTTKATGCAATSDLTISFDTSNAETSGCATCDVATIVVGDCPDCLDDGNGGECSQVASVSCDNSAVVAAGGVHIMGPVTGCDCPGCRVKWINSPSNPTQINIENPYTNTLLISIPTNAIDGEYEFLPLCCDCE